MISQQTIKSLVFNNFTNDSRVLKEAITLQENNFNITIIAHLDNGLKEKEIVNGIPVERISFLDRKTASIFTKIRAYISYIRKAISISKTADILHCHDLNTLPIAYFVKRFYNKSVKVVYDAHEFEINHFPNESKIKIKLNFYAERFLIKCANEVITVSNSIAKEYAKLYNINEPTVVLNAPKLFDQKKTNYFRSELGILNSSKIALYQGSLSKGRGIELLIETFNLRSDDKVVVVFMGYGELENLVKKASEESKNIFFFPAVAPDKILEYTSSADIGISFIENVCLSYYYCLPNKLFEYTMAGLPVFVSNMKDMSELVKKYNIGVVIPENKAKKINEAINEIDKLDLNALKINARKCAEENSWEIQEQKIINLYKKLK